ncbi:MAG: acyl CoA:acetate/3-ketoacid CoA transferase [Desulfocapsaceae bacterium]
MFSIISAREAAEFINDGVTVAIGGAGAGHAVPDRLMQGLGERYEQTGGPRKIRVLHPCGIGDNDSRGMNHLAHEGLVDTAIGGYWGNAPKMVALALENKVKGYNFPQGVLGHLMRAIASGKPGIITPIGLHTYVDPRLEGGKLNDITTEELVEVIEIDSKEYLFYKSIPVDVAFIRGTTIDCEGNLTMEEEVGTFSMLSIAQSAKVNNGIVIAQVKRTFDGHSDPGQVKVPGIFIDHVVVEPEQEMTFLTAFDPALVKRDVDYEAEELRLEGVKRVVSRRAALELRPGIYVNLGYGMSDGVPIVAQQEEITDELVFMIEQGAIAGIPTTGLNFGAMFNPTAIVDDVYQFDFFHGGGLDMAFLGFAQVDRSGNINSTRFNNFITGSGGAIDISSAAKKIVFCGTFAVRGEQQITADGLRVTNPGKAKKFVDRVEQVTFSGESAFDRGQSVFYVTERAVFSLTPDGVMLLEIAPGVDLQKDVLAMMEFKPIVSSELTTIDSRVYRDELLGLKSHFQQLKQQKL